MRHLTTNVAFAGFIALASTACMVDIQGEAVVNRDEKRFTVSGEPELNLRTFDGSIQVRSWDQKDVRVEIERRGPDAQTAAALVVNVTQEGNRIVVDAPKPPRRDGFHVGPGPSVSLIVTAPRRLSLEAHTGDGSIAAKEVSGALVLQTGDGSIRLTRVEGRVKAHTGDGSIRISDATGLVDADTGDGSIDLAGRLEGLSLRTGDGSIRVDVKDGSSLSGDWSITTGDGAIDLRVPPSLNAELEATTGDGHVNATGIAGSSTDRDGTRRALRARLGAGGPMLRVRSGDGSIAIVR